MGRERASAGLIAAVAAVMASCTVVFGDFELRSTMGAGGVGGQASATSGSTGTGGSTSSSSTSSSTSSSSTSSSGTGVSSTSSTSSSGSTSSSSSGGLTYACPGAKPTGPLITDFSMVTGTGANASFATPSSGLFGGFYLFGNAGILVSSTGAQVISASTATSYDGIGMYLGEGSNGCIDASAFGGITFTLKDTGTTPAPIGYFTFAVVTKSTKPTFDMPPGSCDPMGTTDDGAAYPYCHGRNVTLTVTANGVYTVRWTDLPGTSQAPQSSAPFDPSEIVQLSWTLSSQMSQHLNVTISKVAFIP